MKKYELTKSHKKQLKPWADKWIANAMSTKPMDEQDREICRKAVKGLYEAAGKVPPPDHRIVFVSSPFILRFAGGFAAAIWHKRKTGFKNDQATEEATRQATDQKQGWRFPVEAMRSLSVALDLGTFGLSCARNVYYNMWQGGNQWSSWVGFLTFFRHVVKLKLDYSKFHHWEQLAIHCGPRVMHEEFCMISDRPLVLTVNARNQPHRADGPFQEWSDGSAIFALNGIFVPEWVVMTPVDQITKEMIVKETNADIRREIIRRIGNERLLKVFDYKVIDRLDDYELITFDIGDGRTRPFLKMINPSDPKLLHVEGVKPEIITVKAAISYRNGLAEYEAPVVLS